MSNITQEDVGQDKHFAKLGTQVIFDEHIYDSGSKHEGYHSSVHPIDHIEDDEDVDLYGRNTTEAANIRLSLQNIDENDTLIDTSNLRKVTILLVFKDVLPWLCWDL